MSINNTPEIGPYTELKPFRFWCQKVLPLVYDESLSYYELLCKVVDYLNKTMEDVDNMIDDMGEFKTAYDELINYVNTYFDNLDVQEEINKKIDEMAESGYFNTLFVSLFSEDVIETAGTITTAWINENLSQETGYVIDKSLTVEGAAADAKATGDRINVVENTIFDYSGLIEFRNWEEGCIATNTETIDPTNVNVNPACRHMVIDCTDLKYVLIRARGATSTYRPFAFIDSSNNRLKSGQANNFYNFLCEVPTGAVKLIVNTAATYEDESFVYSGNWNMAYSEIDDLKEHDDSKNLKACWGSGLYTIVDNELDSFANWSTRLYQGKSTITSYDHDIIISANEGYQYKVYEKINGTWTMMYNDSWILNKHTRIPANTEFIVQISEYPVSSSTILYVSDMIKNIRVKDADSNISFNKPYMAVQKAKISAHRGYMGDTSNIPPNSLLAIQTAIDLGAWCIETDIRETSDHHFIIMHNETVDATTDGSGTVSSMTLAQIEALHLTGGDGTEKVPTLEEVLKKIKPYGVLLSCDLKGYSDLATSIPAIVELIKYYGLEQNIMFLCYSEDEINFLETHYPNFLKAYTCLDNNDFQDVVDIMKNYTNAAIVFPSTDLMTYISQIVPACRPYNIMVIMYSSSAWAAQCTYFRAGVDIVTSNSNLTAQ